MRKIPFIVLFIELIVLVIYGETIDSLYLHSKGEYLLSYGNIEEIKILKPDSVINYIIIDSIKGIVYNKTDFEDTILMIVSYKSRDENFLIEKHYLESYPNDLKFSNSKPKMDKEKNESKDNSRNFINGLNVLNFNMNDYNGFSVNTAANNHFDYRSSGGILVSGYIDDNNKIFSGEGAYISDISGFNVGVAKEGNSIKIGDIAYKLNSLNQKMIGIDIKSENRFRIIAGLDGGERGNIVIELENNNLGPYTIIPPTDTLYYISPNSEQVFLDGKNLKNGIDYTINYQYGTITFLPSIKIKNGSKVNITYQVKSRYNLRHYIHLESKIHNSLSFSYDETRDWKKNIFNIPYDSATIIDSFIILNGVIYTGENKGSYIKAGNHYIYVGNNRGNYNCHFTYIGDSAGDYTFDNDIHGFLYVGYMKGDYLPIIKIRSPQLKRSVTLHGEKGGISSYLNILQYQNNILSNHTDYNFSGEFSYNNIYKTKTDTLLLKPFLNWYQNIENNDFSNHIAEIQSGFNLSNPGNFRNVLLPGLSAQYNYKNKLYIKSSASELLLKNKIFRTNDVILLKLNKYLFTSHSLNYLSDSKFNRGESKQSYIIGLKKSDLLLKAFYRINNIDSLYTTEKGFNITKSFIDLSLYRKFYNGHSTMNYDLSAHSNKLLFHLYLENDSNILSNQFSIQFSKRFKLLYLSISGEGGDYKPFFLFPYFIESASGNYDYDSLNNVYYISETGHFKKEFLYKQYDKPLQSYDINFILQSNSYLTFNNKINIKRCYTQYNDSINKDDKFTMNSTIHKTFKANDSDVRFDFILSNLITSSNISAELLHRSNNSAEIYTIHIGYKNHSDETPYTQSFSKDINGFVGYSISLFHIKFFSRYIQYSLPKFQNVFHMGTELSFSCDIIDSRLTLSPIFNYNLYSYDNHFGEIDENYPKGLDLITKLNILHDLGSNTHLNINMDIRYNKVKGLFKSFNMAIGINL